MPATQDGVWVSVSARTDVGMRRSGNEDSFLVADLTTGRMGLSPEMTQHRLGIRGTLLIVSDGMGGAAAGEVASSMAVQIVHEEMSRNFVPGAAVPTVLRQASDTANQKIWEKSQKDLTVRGLGATLTAAFVLGGKLYVSQVGDSRAYIIRRQQIKQVTEDQSWANAIKKSGIDHSHVPSNVILQALGTQPSLNAEVTSIFLCRGDYLLLCSDGLSNKIQDQEMQTAVVGAADLDGACRALIELANQRGGEDNITVVLARFDGNLLPLPDELSVTATFAIVSNGDEGMMEPAASATGPLHAQTAMLTSESTPPPTQPQTVPYPTFHPARPPGPSVAAPSVPAAETTLPYGQPPAQSYSTANRSLPLAAVIPAVLVFLVAGAGVVLLTLKFTAPSETTGYNQGATPANPTTGMDGTKSNERDSLNATLTLVKETLAVVEQVLSKNDLLGTGKEAQTARQKCKTFETELQEAQTELEKLAAGKGKLSAQDRTQIEKWKTRADAIQEEIKKMTSLQGRPGVGNSPGSDAPSEPPDKLSPHRQK
ncbi:MAG: protein phosphatase 2C domain-containing protein [Blastocatellia bacterium]|nr:protein phosphatase 2C domain-containing protein [Blastocatellia bacterium]